MLLISGALSFAIPASLLQVGLDQMVADLLHSAFSIPLGLEIKSPEKAPVVFPKSSLLFLNLPSPTTPLSPQFAGAAQVREEETLRTVQSRKKYAGNTRQEEMLV